MTLEIIERPEDWLPLEPVWDSLVERMATRSVFMRWDWMRIWQEEHRAEAELAVAVARDGSGQVRGIAPLVIGREAGAMRGSLRHLAFLASIGDAQGERFDFIVPAGEESLVAPVLCGVFERLRSRWDTIYLKKVPEESPNLPFILDAMRRAGRSASVLNEHHCRIARLPATYLDYEMRHSVSWRSKIRRKWRAMERELGGHPLLGGRDLSCDETIRHLARLHATRWAAGESIFITERSLAVHRRLARRWLPEGRLVAPFIALGDRPVAMVHGFLEREEFCQFQIGWDAAYARSALGRVAMVWSFRHVIELGAKIYDLLPGEEDYKASWCPEMRRQFDLEAFHPRSLRARVFTSARSLRRLAFGRPQPPSPSKPRDSSPSDPAEP
jgi:CelD/BcsL family acetyltransferase involved in cellulose biosynthesis